VAAAPLSVAGAAGAAGESSPPLSSVRVPPAAPFAVPSPLRILLLRERRTSSSATARRLSGCEVEPHHVATGLSEVSNRARRFAGIKAQSDFDVEEGHTNKTRSFKKMFWSDLLFKES
jgi:hypothetical protein